MTKCKGPHYDFDDFTALYDLTTFVTTSRLHRLLILNRSRSWFCTRHT